jgi:thiol:disulfide interchange protein
MNSIKRLFLLFFSFSVVAASAQIEDPVKWKFSQKQISDTEVELYFEATLEKKWHLYAQKLESDLGPVPTSFVFEESAQYERVGGVKEPKPKVEYDPNFEMNLSYFEKQVKFTQRIKIKSETDFKLKGYVEYMVCDDEKCLPPTEENFVFVIKGAKIDTPSSVGSESPSIEEDEKDSLDTSSSNTTTEENPIANKAEKEAPSKTPKRSLITIFIIAFFSGFAALLTPCVFPMIPMTVSFFTKQSKTRAKGIRNAILYGISIVVIYVVLGTVVTAIFGSDALNALSTNVWFNIIFFLLLVIFAISFMGAFEITLPASWVNKADKASDRGGLIGIFFMAFTLALVSFSCTGPIVGTLLVESATIGGSGPFVGMLGFSLALALPFGLFAAFPGWMNTLPKSGGWLNTVKVFLGFLELALAFKFLSNADMVVQGHYLERELFLAIWIAIFAVLALYLFGFIQLPHDSKLENISVGRALLGITSLMFVIYMIPGLFGAPLKLISAFPPPKWYSESPLGFFGNANTQVENTTHSEGTHLGPQGLPVFHDLELGMAHARETNKPIFLDFTGYACVNCRKMEEHVWGEPGVIEILKNDVVIVSLYVDDKTELPKEEQIDVEIVPGKTKTLKTLGNKWSYLQANKYKTNTQPYYRMLTSDGTDLSNGAADYEHHGSVAAFKAWLEEGLNANEKIAQ